MNVIFDFSDIISVLALGLAGFSTFKAIHFGRTQDKLNKLHLKKEQDEASQREAADLSASFISVGKNRERLKIFNRGKSSARNIRIEFPNGNDIVMTSGWNDIFPHEKLEPQQSIELTAAPTLQSKKVLKIKLIWDDNTGSDKDNTLTVTL